MLGSCPDYIYFLTHGGQGGIGCNSKFKSREKAFTPEELPLYLMCFLLSQNNNILLNLRVYP
jgi:hypothetical protein